MQYEEALAKLNEYQRAAVLDESPACLVNAIVGSGKTTVLIAKLLYLHEAKEIPYDDMVVLTFTNKAADEIKERLYKADKTLLPEQLLWFGTFHGVCLSLLKTRLPVEQIGFTTEFLVMTPEEELEMAQQLIIEQGLKIKYKNRLKRRLERAMLIREEEKKISKYQDDIFVLTKLLETEKKKQNKMTYQDLVENTLTLLPLCPDIKPSWIIVDEVQDSDSFQLELLELLKKEETRLFAVGDPNQVIYSWRGSAFQVFYTLRTRYQATELSLPINYRSSGSILEAARYFLQNGNKLEGVKETGNKIVITNHYNAFQEADYLAGKIKKLQEAGIPYGEIAVFYRLQSQSKTLEDVLTREGIPVEVSLRKSIQDIPVLNWLIKVLRFSVNHRDNTSAIAVLSNREYGIGCKEKEVKKHLLQDVDGLAYTMQHFSQAVAEGLMVSAYYEYFSFDDYLRPTSASFLEDKKAVLRFFTVLSERTQETLSIIKLQEFLNESTLYGMDIFEQSLDTTSDTVKLMTLHASKGLEFSHVFIVGVNYGLIPMQSKGMEGEEEERRLFFVGITRAKEFLELSYYTSPEQYRVSPGPSSYLRMIPAKLVEEDTLSKPAVIDVQERLQEIKKQILAAKAEGKIIEEPMIPLPILQERQHVQRVRHAKYGMGSIVGENEDTVVVDFEDYGEKEFLKMFSELDYL